MFKFSHSSLDKLSTCSQDLQVLFTEVIKIIDCKVIEGYRDVDKQNAAFLTGKSKLQYPYGKHNSIPSNAIDVAPYPIDWNNHARFYWFAGIVMGVAKMLKAQGKISREIIYGGDWNKNYDITDENGLRDLVHFELV